MKNEKKKILSLLLAAALAVSACVADISALEEQRETSVISENAIVPATEEEVNQYTLDERCYTYKDIDFSVPDYVPTGIQPQKATALPTSYNSYSEGDSTSIKNQNPYGSCWAFSATSTAESTMITGEKEIDGALATASNTDFSELQLAYFFYNKVDDPLHNTTGDRTVNTGTDSSGQPVSFLSQGGNHVFTVWGLASWCNAVKETDVPYGQATSVLSNGLDEKYAYDRSVAHLMDARILNISDSDAVKQMIMDYGCVSVSYYHDSNYENSNGAYYYPSNPGTNHAVCLVGWNDNYSKYKFLSQHRPSSNGAWLMKNSWGTSIGDNGYYWISYEDASLKAGEAFVYIYDSADAVDFNYQYDGSYGSAHDYVISEGSIANVYEVKGSDYERLESVGVGLETTGVSYSVQIYKLASRESSPSSGEALLKTPVTGSTTYSGFYNIPLNQEVILQKGDIYSVVIQLTAPDDVDYVYYYVASTYQNGDWISFTNETEHNQSYYKYSIEQKWTDYKNYGQGTYTARLKAYSNAVVPVKLNLINATADQTGNIYSRRNHSYKVTIAPNAGYTMPASITVKAGTKTLIAGLDYGYNNATGEVNILAEAVTDNITVMAEAPAEIAVVAAKIGDTGFATLAEALAAAESGVTVELASDVSNEKYIFVDAGITLNLNGHNITDTDLIYVSGNIQDTADSRGILKAERYLFAQTVTSMPVYDKQQDGYSLFNLGIQFFNDDTTATSGAGTCKLYVPFYDSEDFIKANTLLKQAGSGCRMKLYFVLSWIDSSGNAVEQTVTLRSDLLVDYLNSDNGKAPYVMVSGLDRLASQVTFSAKYTVFNADPYDLESNAIEIGSVRLLPEVIKEAAK